MQTLGSSASQPSTSERPVCSGGSCGVAAWAAGTARARTRASRLRRRAFRRMLLRNARVQRNLRLRPRSAAGGAVAADVQHSEERVLRHLDAPDLLHALLALLLALEQLALAADVAAVALG